jgi:hypothetical protein
VHPLLSIGLFFLGDPRDLTAEVFPFRFPRGASCD